MASKREVPGLADLIATVISPILIMAMVGALIYFIIEVIYGGDYVDRLRWTFFFFVFGSVLVARMAIEFGDARAGMYAGVLGVVSFIAMLRFVEYPPGFIGQIGPVLNIGLLVLVWWAARKLTWDCTYIDDNREVSDRSLTEAAGLDQLERPPEWREPERPAEEERPLNENATWIERYFRWRKAQDKKPHTPGVWVVYFSLAALPIFGLGQSLIDPNDGKSRSFSFWLMVIYVGSGLGLLMTTAFLGLRRYLKQRKIQIPGSMAGLWLGVGTAIILLFLAVAAILPRPNSETPLVKLDSITGSKDRDASEYAMNGDGQGKGDGAGGNEKSENAQSQSSLEGKSNEGGKGQGQDGANKGSGQDQGKGGDSGNSKQSGDQKGGDKSGESKDPNNDKKKGEKSNDPNGQNKTPDKSGQKSDNQKGQESGGQSGGGGQQRQNKQNAQNNRSSRPTRPPNSTRGPLSMDRFGLFGRIFKWVVFALLAIGVVYFLFRHGLKFLANFMAWPRQLLDFLNNFWARLFGGTVMPSEPAVVEDFAVVQERPRPFASFQNPFDSGEAEGLSSDELVDYSFSALEAWAYEHERSRDPQETPLEFARRLGKDYESLHQEAPRLANLYARLAYARGSLPETSREQVAEFWRHLELASDEARPAQPQQSLAD
jgi:hypothetical protein